MTIILIFLSAFVLRYIAVRNTPPGVDTYGHLYYAKEVARQHAGIFGAIRTRVIGSSELRHPFLWHWIVGFFPITSVIRYQHFINPILDALFTVLIFVICNKIEYQEFAYYAVALYLFTPMWFSKLSIGPRIAGFTPRLASEIATNLLFIVLFVDVGLPPHLCFGLATAASIFVLLSSKFGLQAILFLLPLASLLSHSLLALEVLATSTLLAIAMSRGLFFRTSAAQLRHLAWYFTKNLKGEMAVSGRNSLRKLFQRTDPSTSRKKHLQIVVLRMLSYNSLTAVLLKMPVASIVWGALLMSAYPHSVLASSVMIPIVAASLVFFCVNIPCLLFLGEAERYLNHVAFFFCVAATEIMVRHDLEWILWSVCVYGVLYWLVESFGLDRILNREQAQEDSIVQFLGQLNEKAVILCYPYNAIGNFRIMLETEHGVIDGYNADPKFSKYYEERFAAEYPYAKLESVNLMHSELQLSVVVVRIKDLAARGQANWIPGNEWIEEKITTAPAYRIYLRTHHDAPLTAKA